MGGFNTAQYMRLRNKALARYEFDREVRVSNTLDGLSHLSFHFKDGRVDENTLLVPKGLALSMLLLGTEAVVRLDHKTNSACNGVLWITDGLINFSILVPEFTRMGIKQTPWMKSESLEEEHFRGLLNHMSYQLDVFRASSQCSYEQIMADLVKS